MEGDGRVSEVIVLDSEGGSGYKGPSEPTLSLRTRNLDLCRVKFETHQDDYYLRDWYPFENKGEGIVSLCPCKDRTDNPPNLHRYTYFMSQVVDRGPLSKLFTSEGKDPRGKMGKDGLNGFY